MGGPGSVACGWEVGGGCNMARRAGLADEPRPPPPPFFFGVDLSRVAGSPGSGTSKRSRCGRALSGRTRSPPAISRRRTRSPTRTTWRKCKIRESPWGPQPPVSVAAAEESRTQVAWCSRPSVGSNPVASRVKPAPPPAHTATLPTALGRRSIISYRHTPSCAARLPIMGEQRRGSAGVEGLAADGVLVWRAGPQKGRHAPFPAGLSPASTRRSPFRGLFMIC